jgi:hypothetical protein
MAMILFDRLIYVDRLKRAGITEEHARAHADAMDEALRESVVTKSDLQLLKSDLELLKRDLTIRFGAMQAALFGLLAAIKC